MAYNLKNYLAMDRRVGGEVVEGAPKPENEIAALIEVIAREKPDILGVCEIGDEPFLLDLQKRLKAKGVDLPETELIHAASGWERNLGLLTRFPIVSRQSRGDLSYTIEQTRLPFQRGILDVTLKLSESYRLRCVGLHLKSKREVPEAPQEEMRRHEAHLARQHLDEIFAAEPGANVLVYGDMNEDPPEPPIKALRGRFGGQGYLSDLRLRDRYGFRWTHYWEFADNYSRFDYALVSQGLLPEIDRDRSHIPHAEGWDTASDHRPLVVYLTPRDR
ncbi:MAG: endonuclease/exonuclease/phosphatase family protein [Verrucomicrobiae bacterium]|nr:endonuclease/exonuclease/phosphatase family protein [Verrucomicrobiae bacterium]